MDKNQYLVIHVDALPEVYLKVTQAKDILKNETAKSVSDAVKEVGISRSTFYKYSEYVFTLSDGVMGKSAVVSLMLSHQSGILSRVLDTVAHYNGNISTISQSSPINKKASATLEIDISNLNDTFSNLLNALKAIDGVVKSTLLAIE